MLKLKTTVGRVARRAAWALMASVSLVAMPAHSESKGTVHLAYVEWSSTVASTNVVRVALEKAGYDVKTTSLAGAAMWQAVANGDADALLAGWLPTTHEDYFEQLGDQVDRKSTRLNSSHVRISYAVF